MRLIYWIVAGLIAAAIMAAVKPLAHVVVDLGPVPWLIAMAGILWIGIAIENRGARRRRPPPLLLE
jgi:hypothetical protein